MAAHGHELVSRPSRPRRLLGAVATISVILLSLASIPAATARPGHEKAPATESSAPADSSTKAAPGAHHATPETVAAKGESGDSPSGGESGAGSGAAQQSAPAHRSEPQHRQDTGKGGGHGHAKEPSSAGHGKSSPGGVDVGQENAGSAAQPLTKSSKGQRTVEPTLEAERRRAQERAGRPASSHVGHGKGKQIEASRSGSVPSEASPSPAEVTAPSPAAPLATVASSSPAPLASSATVAAPALARQANQASASAKRTKRAHARRRASAARRSVARATGASAAVLGSAASALAQPGLKPAKRAHRAGTHAKNHEASSPLTRTLTKIVGVVPTPVRILIGALLALATALGLRSRLIARRARRLERQRGELLEDVGLLQAALLPVVPARLGPVATTAAYRPAAGPAAGGDFYDVFALEDGQLAVIVGDVSGHGRKALPHTALVRFTMRAYLEAGLSPRGAVQTAGAVLERQLGDSFATVVAATYNPRTRRLVYSSAGHPPPVLLGTEPGQQPLEPLTVCASPPLGVGMASGTRQTIVAIPGAAQICFYTDGVTEARVGTELFGPTRLAGTLAAIGPAGEAAELLDRVSAQADRRPDDMAACLLSVAGSAAAPYGVVEELELDRESVVSDRARQLLLACGVEAAAARVALDSAAQIVAAAGSVVLEVHRADGHARVSFQNDNLTYLQTRHAARQADRMVTL